VRRGGGAKLPREPRLEAFEGDVLNPADVEAALEGREAVVHLVGTRRAAIKKTGLGYDDVDVASARIMAAAMKRRGVARILLLSAGAIGGSPYVLAKGRAERAVTDAGLAWTIFRPSFILGPGQQWPRLIEPILALAGLLPGHAGDLARRARAITREELGRSMVWSLAHDEAIGRVYDVPGIRDLARLPQPSPPRTP
jgi:NADH dehydrogenase